MYFQSKNFFISQKKNFKCSRCRERKLGARNSFKIRKHCLLIFFSNFQRALGTMLDKVTESLLSLQLEDPEEGQGSGAHMISTARVPADKPVRIAFSLDSAAGMLCSEEKRPPTTTPPAAFLPSSFPRSVFKNACLGSSLAVQWLGLCPLSAGATGSILGQGTKILHAAWP